MYKCLKSIKYNIYIENSATIRDNGGNNEKHE